MILLAITILAPLLAISAGAWASGSAMAFAPNVVAFLVGVALLIAAKTVVPFLRHNRIIFGTVTIALIAATYLSPDRESVHRWISFGPISLNIAMAFLPIAIFAIIHVDGLVRLAMLSSLSLIFIFQPDAGQATAFALAATALLILERREALWIRTCEILLMVGAAAISWLRPDPLLAVDRVERILHLIGAHGLTGVLLNCLIISLLFIPLIFNRAPLILTASYVAYFVGAFFTTTLGNFPVPVIGAGAAPVLGWFLMVMFLREGLTPPQRLNTAPPRGER